MTLISKQEVICARVYVYDEDNLSIVRFFPLRPWWTSWTRTPSSWGRWCPCTWTAWESKCSWPAPSTRCCGASRTPSSPKSTPWSPKWTSTSGWCGRWERSLGLLNNKSLREVRLTACWRKTLLLPRLWSHVCNLAQVVTARALWSWEKHFGFKNKTFSHHQKSDQ